jgi:hypothetical protein
MTPASYLREFFVEPADWLRWRPVVLSANDNVVRPLHPCLQFFRRATAERVASIARQQYADGRFAGAKEHVP